LASIKTPSPILRDDSKYLAEGVKLVRNIFQSGSYDYALVVQAAAGESDWFRHPSTWLARSRELGKSNRQLAKYILDNETHHRRLAAEAARDAAKGKAYLEKLPFPDGFNLFDYPERLIFELFRDGTLGSYIHGIPSVRQEALRKKFKEMATA
jgi:hypothetical protein